MQADLQRSHPLQRASGTALAQWQGISSRDPLNAKKVHSALRLAKNPVSGDKPIVQYMNYREVPMSVRGSRATRRHAASERAWDAIDAVVEGTYDAYEGSHMSWTPMILDEQGREEMTQFSNALCWTPSPSRGRERAAGI